MKGKKKKLAQNTFSLYLMNIVKLIFPLFTLPYLTRVLSTNTYGVVTYVKALIVYVQLILDFGFLLSATKDIVSANGDKKIINAIIGDTIVSKIFLAVIASIIYIVLTLLIPLMRNNFMFSFIYLCSTLLSILILDFLFRGIEKMNYVAIPYICAKTVTLIMTFILVKGDNDILYIPILDLVGNFIAAMLSLFFLKRLHYNIEFSGIKKCLINLKTSFIYFISNFATTIFGALTTIIAGLYISPGEIAFWGICMQLLSAAKSMYNPLTNSLYPYMLKEKDIGIVNNISHLMIFPMLVGILTVLFGSNLILKLIGGAKYVGAATTLKYLLPAFIFSFYSMLYGWPVLGAIGKVKETSYSTIFASIFQIIGLILLGVTKNFSLKTLAICCSITEFILFVIRIYIVYHSKDKFKLRGE